MSSLYTAAFALAKFNTASAAYDQAAAAAASAINDPQVEASVTRQRLAELSAEMDKWSRLYSRLSDGGGIKLFAAVPTDG